MIILLCGIMSSYSLCHSEFHLLVTSLVILTWGHPTYVSFKIFVFSDLTGEWHEVNLHDVSSNEVILHYFYTKFQPPMASVVNDMRSSFLMCHTQYLPPVTSLVSDMRSDCFMYHTVFSLPWPHWWVTWGYPTWCVKKNCALLWYLSRIPAAKYGLTGVRISESMRSSYMIFIHNFNFQWPQWWVIWGHSSWYNTQYTITSSSDLTGEGHEVILLHVSYSILTSSDLTGECHEVILIDVSYRIVHLWYLFVHHVSYNWAHRRSNFRVTSHGTGFLVSPLRSLES
jgi:hypothetical protein